MRASRMLRAAGSRQREMRERMDSMRQIVKENLEHLEREAKEWAEIGCYESEDA